MTDSHSDVLVESAWSGGGSPFAIGSKKLGMWLFIASDTLTFAALLLTYSYSRMTNPNWPKPFPIVPAIVFSTIMTIVLLGSSLTMVMGVAAAHRGNRASTVKWMLATMLGGAIFCGLHFTEWMHLIAEELRPFSNKFGPGGTAGAPLFGATFFGITGLHMTHVAIGVIYLGIVATGFGRGKFSSEDVEVSGLYWHFVDLVWMFVFPMIYLMSVKY
ncbi:MAG TPA: cytochrome c oxidase subunit 3 [Candidatus Acidoferrales bacterium]|nr:cytochrome c oxidase subunit 3 [Candidatus Acidoferrales bacterium]